MQYKEISLASFTIAGISVRTSNKEGKSQKDIGELWNRFFSQQTSEAIPNKVSDEIYCIYTDYESNFMGAYTTILGCRVSDTQNLPTGMVVKHIPTGRYHEYRSEGKLPECVGQTWMNIWQSPDTNRMYEADFDIYGAEAQNPENAVVATFVSVKE